MERDERATNFCRSQLCVVQRNDHRQDTNTKTSDEASSVDVIGIFCAGLDDDANDKDADTNLGGNLAAKFVCVVSVDQDTDPGAELEDAVG